MKTEQEVYDLSTLINDGAPSKYPGMSYEQGIAEALMWVLGELTDEEFADAFKEG